MSTHDAVFDQQFGALLEQQASAAGESVQTYVQRAVATRMVDDMTRRSDPQIDSLHGHLVKLGVSPVERAGVEGSVPADPRRLRAVRETGLLDKAADPAFDRIVRMAAEALKTPSAALTLLDEDRLFFVSAVGIGETLGAARELQMGDSIGRLVVEARHTLVIEDAANHPTLAEVPFVRDRKVVAYLGIPLIDADGYAIGSFAVWDTQPRLWGTGHVETLHDFARMAWMRIFGAAGAGNGQAKG